LWCLLDYGGKVNGSGIPGIIAVSLLQTLTET